LVSELQEASAACARFKAGFYKRYGVLRDSFVWKRYGLLRQADSATLFNPYFRG
jgi:hypothetical protein